MENGMVDLGLLLEPSDTSTYEFIRMDTKEQWGAMICDTCPLSKKEYLTAADIVKYPIMLPSRDSIKNELINWFGDMAEKLNISATFNLSYNSGINYFDLAAGDGPAFTYFGKAIGDVRKNIFYQVHFGANYETGTYGKTASVDTMRRSIAWQLENLKTDYIDYGFVHCIDDVNEWYRFRDNGSLSYLMELKKSGAVHHIGFSSHTPATIMQVMDDVPLDVLMFSVNPAYDYQKGSYGFGSVDERTAVYRRCEKEGTGITVMKPFSGGQLLDAKASPFGKSLTHYQCIQYALDRPGVLTVLPGIANREHLSHLPDYFNSTEAERDYSVIGSFSPADAKGKCVYCNHCKPCPSALTSAL